jgi:hypothetical protein
MADTATILEKTMETERFDPETGEEEDFDGLLARALEALPVPEAPVEENLDDIPEAVPVRKPPVLAPLPSNTGTPRGVRRVSALPTKRNAAAEVVPERSSEKQPIDVSRFQTFDAHRNGEFRVEPLERVPGERRQRGNAPAPKFLDGELPRSVERGIRYPNPGLVRFAAVFLLVTRLFMVASMIALPLIAFLAPELMPKYAWIPATFLGAGLIFLLSARRCRCRVCSCHLFFVKRCFKNRNAHRLKFLGYAGSAALHVLLFRWMRCMYCGTAIRMRIPKGDEHLYP